MGNVEEEFSDKKSTGKIFSSIFSGSSNLSFRVKSNDASTALAIFSSWILSLASGWTTYHGILFFLPNEYIAFLATLGIQLLLLSSSIKVSEDFVVTRFNLKQLIILVASIATSVFFSFQSFFASIYSHEMRITDRLSEAQSAYYIELSKIKSTSESVLKTEVSNSTDLVNNGSIIFGEKVNAVINKEIVAINIEITRQMNISTESERLKENEVEQGSPPNLAVGKFKKTKNGLGKWSDYYDNKFKLAQAEIFKLEGEKRELVNLGAKLAKTYSNFIAHGHDLKGFSINCYSLIGELNSQEVSNLCVTNRNQNNFLGIIEEKEKINLFFSTCGELESPSYHEFVSSAIKCISNSPIDAGLKEKSIEKLDGIFSSINPEQHQFVVLTQELIKGETLSVLSLSIAFLVDSLIFLCVLSGAKASSYLYLKTKEDLNNVQTESLELVLQVKKNEFQELLSEDNRLVIIYRLIEFDHLALLESKTPAVINLDCDEVQMLGDVFGTLLYHDHAILLDEHKTSIMGEIREGLEFKEQIRLAKYIGLRLGFILWGLDFLDREIGAKRFKHNYSDPLSSIVSKIFKRH